MGRRGLRLSTSTERNALLLAILNSGRVPVTRLELSTAEAMAHIQPDKFAILREIYAMAKEQEMRRNNPGPSPECTLTWIASLTPLRRSDYKPRLPLTVVSVLPHGPSPMDDHLGRDSTLGKRQRSVSENITDTEPRRQSRRLTLGMQSMHDMSRSDSLPGSRQPSATIPRGQIAPQPTISPSHPMHHLPMPPHPFAFAPHGMPPMLHHPDVVGFDPQRLHHLDVPGPQQFPPPLHGATFPFGPFGGEHLAFSLPPHLSLPGFNEELAHLIARRSAQSAQAPQSLNHPPNQQAAGLPFPPSPNSIAMMMWAGIPTESLPQHPLLGEGVTTPGIYHPMPSYPSSVQADSWSSDSQQLDPVDESRPATPPEETLSTTITSAPMAESQPSSITDDLDAAWLK